MKFRMLLTLLLGAAGLALAAGEKQGASPSEVQMKAVEATRNLDYGTLANLSCGRQKDKFEKYAEIIALAEKRAADGDEKTKRKLKANRIKLKNWQVEITGEKIDGDFATVYYVCSGLSFDKGMARFRKVGGEWKLADDSEYLKERAFAVETGKTVGGTPSQVVAKLGEAIRTCDFDTMIGLYYGTEKMKVLNAADRFAMLSFAAKKGNSKARKDLEKFNAFRTKSLGLETEIRGEKIDGDLAVVDVVLNGGFYESENASDPQYLKKINGEWKVIGKSAYDKEKAARKDR